MELETRIRAFAELGRQIAALSPDEVSALAGRVANRNAWFDEPNVRLALSATQSLLEEQDLRKWLAAYDFSRLRPQRVGVVMAGNIPLAGFHDFMCVLLSGHELHAKLHAEDTQLLPFLANKLLAIEPGFSSQIHYPDFLRDVDALIATGSGNATRYLEQYFAQKPHLIRHNRYGLGILSGQETTTQLRALGQDILQYYGLGARSVSKVLVPEGYDFTSFFESIEEMNEVGLHHKYRNNYDYQKSILLVNRVPHFDNGFLCLRQTEELISPISILFYDTYTVPEEIPLFLEHHAGHLQCLVSADGWYPASLPFGRAHKPSPLDYADDQDTMAFLTRLN